MMEIFFQKQLLAFNAWSASVALTKKPVNLLRKSIGWFLYEGSTGI